MSARQKQSAWQRQSAWQTQVVGLSLSSAVTFCAVFVFFVNTRVGQNIDDRALLGREVLPSEVVRLMNELLGFSTPFFAVLFTVIILVIGWRNGRGLLGIALAVGYAITEVTSESMKMFFNRPELDMMFANDLGKKALSTFPSGTVALTCGFILSLIAVVQAAKKSKVSRFGVVIVGLVGILVVLTGWHRPSDALAAISLATFSASVALFLGTRRHVAKSTHIGPVSLRGPFTSAAILGLLAIVLCVFLGFHNDLPAGVWPVSLYSFMFIIPAYAALMVTAFTRLAGLGYTR